MSPSAGPPSDTPSPPTAAGSPRTSTSVTSDPGSSKGEDVTKQPSQTAARRGTSNTATGHQAKPYLRESQPQEGGGLDGCRRGVSLQGQHGAQQADLTVSTQSGVLTGGNIWPVQTQDSGLESRRRTERARYLESQPGEQNCSASAPVNIHFQELEANTRALEGPPNKVMLQATDGNPQEPGRQFC